MLSNSSHADTVEQKQVKVGSTYQDVVIDSATAQRIAEVILPTIYGNNVLKQRPFKAKLIRGIWHVEGTLPGGPDARGGVATIEIRKTDAKVIEVNHGK